MLSRGDYRIGRSVGCQKHTQKQLTIEREVRHIQRITQCINKKFLHDADRARTLFGRPRSADSGDTCGGGEQRAAEHVGVKVFGSEEIVPNFGIAILELALALLYSAHTVTRASPCRL